jgi:molecular chaperone HtpG
MQKGNIGVTTENIFPIIKKFLYSDHEIFLRELISNAVDASQKLKTLSSVGDYKGNIDNLAINVIIDKKKKRLIISDKGLGMTSVEIEKYINQIAFSSAEEFMDKYKNKANAIIGHFGLGFYSSFMVSSKVEIISKSWQNTQAVKWTCDGTPEYSIEDIEKDNVGTDVILYIDDESKEFLEEERIEGILKKYCKFLPVEIYFGKEKEWKDGKYIDTEKDKIINITKPAWTLKPADLKDEDYKKSYSDLYAFGEEPLFYIHLNVDYPFHLTGILYFPKIKNNFELQKNKIQLYCNQVFVTDSVEGIVPEFLTLLHGVLDSPDIPLNVSRSYLQSDPNVKKISNHITKKVADRLSDIFKTDRQEFEKKWNDIKVFIEYGILTDEKFYEKAKNFCLFKNTDEKYFTFEEYEKIIKDNHTDKNNNLVYLYSTNKETQFSFIEAAKSKGYDVLLMDGQLDIHFINTLEQKFKNTRFVRVDSDVVEKLILKEDTKESKLTEMQKEELIPVFTGILTKEPHFHVTFENMDENDVPILITQSEFMRRMKDMSSMGGGPMSFYGNLPDSYNLVINSNHHLVSQVLSDKEKKLSKEVNELNSKITPLEEDKIKLENSQKDKKEEEKSTEIKDKITDVEKEIIKLKEEKDKILSDYGKNNKIVKQLVDLALLSNNMLKGEQLTTFIKRSIDLIKK